MTLMKRKKPATEVMRTVLKEAKEMRRKAMVEAKDCRMRQGKKERNKRSCLVEAQGTCGLNHLVGYEVRESLRIEEFEIWMSE